MSEAETYAKWVLHKDNVQRAGTYIKLAAKRFLADLKRDDIYFDEVEANKMIFFSENHLKLWEDKWRGKDMIIKPWMAFIFQQIYGWINKSDGLRRVRKVYVQIAKKNAKSTLAGALGNFHLFADERVSTPKIFVGANNEDQAKICTTITGKLIEQSPDLYQYVEDDVVQIFRYKENIINIVHKERDGFIKALSKEGSDKQSKASGGKHGLNPSVGIIDEFGMSQDSNLLNTLESAQAAREEPLIFVITTAGFNMAGPCYQSLRKTGINILEGTMEDDGYLPFIFEMDKGDDINDETVWEKCNPNLDVSVSRAFLRSRLKAAANEGGSKAVDVYTLNFNQWVDSPEVFIPGEVWRENSGSGIRDEDLVGQECYGGIEIVSGRLLNAFCFLFPDIGGKVVLKMCYWMPEENKKNIETDQWPTWCDEGHIKVFGGGVVENDQVTNMLFNHLGNYNMHSFAYKTDMEMSDIVQTLVKAGVQGNTISHGYQGISTPLTTWEELLTARSVEHFNNPVLAWMNGNCLVLRKENSIRIEKSGSKVVGIYAALNALAQWKTIAATEQDDKLLGSW